MWLIETLTFEIGVLDKISFMKSKKGAEIEASSHWLRAPIMQVIPRAALECWLGMFSETER